MPQTINIAPQSVTMVQALRIRDMVATSTVFMERLGVEEIRLSTKRVFVNYVEKAFADIERPFAIVQMGETTKEVDAGGIQNVYLGSGTVKVSYFDNDRLPKDHGNSLIQFYNFFEAAWEDVLQCSGFNGLPKITKSTVSVPMLTGDEKRGGETPFWAVDIAAEWSQL